MHILADLRVEVRMIYTRAFSGQYVGNYSRDFVGRPTVVHIHATSLVSTLERLLVQQKWFISHSKVLETLVVECHL